MGPGDGMRVAIGPRRSDRWNRYHCDGPAHRNVTLMRKETRMSRRSEKPFSAQIGFARVFTALSLVSIAATAIGAVAVGAVAIGRLRVKRGKIERLSIEDLEVGRLRVRELIVENQ